MPDRKKVIREIEDALSDDISKAGYIYGLSLVGLKNKALTDVLFLLKEQPEIVRCKDCKWYDERISLCDNCGLPREQTFFCADGKRK